MDQTRHFCLRPISVLEVTGKDAQKIVNNLTTNEIASLADQAGRETFVTDIKGKTLGHVSVFRDAESFRLVGPAGQSDRIASHFDRYTIVEDAQVAILDDQWSVFVLPPDSVARLIPNFQCSDSRCGIWKLSTPCATGYDVSWLGQHTLALLLPKEDGPSMQDHLLSLELSAADEESFHHARTLAGFPWLGIDFDEQSLPQEVDRDESSISFTKGCYLGQETVARLDAMGQVQKKLVRWELSGRIPDPPMEVVSGGKIVGRLTSIALTSDNQAVAIGIAKRSHFEPGAEARGSSEKGEFTALVS